MIHADVKKSKDIAQLHAAIKHQGPNQQYVVVQTLAQDQGATFKFLIDLGATHSFISIAYIRKLNLSMYADSKLIGKASNR